MPSHHEDGTRVREARELGQTVRRFSRSLVRRASEGELDALVELRECKRQIERDIREAMAESTKHYTYAAIAAEVRSTAPTVYKMAQRALRERESA